MVYICYYSDQLHKIDVDLEEYLLGHKDFYRIPLWVVFDNVNEAIAWWKATKENIIVVKISIWNLDLMIQE